MRHISFTIIFCCLLFTSCREEKQESSPLTVRTSPVLLITEDLSAGYPFISKPYRSSEISFRVSGLVTVLDIYSGKYYRKGSLISSLDQRDYQVRLDKNTALMEQTKAEYERVEALYRLNNISASTYEKAKADYQSASAAYSTALNELTDTKLNAPFDGYVQDVFLEQHQDVKAAQPICSFINIDKIRIELYIPQQVAMDVKAGDNIDIVFDAIPKKRYQATIEQVSKGTVKNNISFLITAMLDNRGHSLLSGMSGKASIGSSHNKTSCLAVCQSAIRHTPTKGTYVWTVDNGSARFTPVIIGKLLRNGLMEIVEGLDCADEIILTGGDLLSDGAKIQVSR